MVDPSAVPEPVIYDTKLSSVGPGNPTDSDSVYEPESMDLAMKLHYIRSIHYFESKAFEGLKILVIKEPMFTWMNQYPVTSGRFRRMESGRPYIKCNDCGVRLLEANCGRTLDEWLETKDDALEKHLVPNQNIGPELSFSPTILMQLTKFKCGGCAIGLSWSHVLGDAYSASEFMVQWSRIVAGHEQVKPVALPTSLTKSIGSPSLSQDAEEPHSIKRVGPVGDNWTNVPECDMVTFSFQVPGTRLSRLQSSMSRNGTQVPTFEALSAVIWQCVARVRGHESGPKVVTICRRGEGNKILGLLSNNQAVSVVRADFPVAEADPSDLATLIRNGGVDDRKKIIGAMEREQGVADFIIYGANLTFVNFEEGGFYEFEYRGERPVHFSLRIDGVGEEGAVLVLPGPKRGGGRIVTTVLPEREISKFKSELKSEGILA